MKRFYDEIKITFGDCDPAKIIYYPTYFRWFDRGTERLFRSVGLPWENFFDDYNLVGLPIVDASATFSKAIKMGHTVIFETWIDEWRTRTLAVKHRVTHEGDPVAEGQEIRVWAVRDPDAEKGIRASPIPAEVIARFEGD